MSLQDRNSGGHPGPAGKAEAARLVAKARTTPLTDGGLTVDRLLGDALAADPQNHAARVLLDRLHQQAVPRWHFPMMADATRNRAYARAIAAKVRPGDIVLDIGCGAGLTAMMAARAGAAHVYTCEQQPLIAAAATRVIADNGLSDRITVIPRLSHTLVVGQDLPERADVVISEIVDTVLLGEGALDTLSHAMRELAKPGARAIPETGTLMARLVECPSLAERLRPACAEGFDLRAFHRFAGVARVTAGEFAGLDMRMVGPTVPLFEFDLSRPAPGPGCVTVDLPCWVSGTVHAVLVAFALDLAPGVRVSNDIGHGGHWGRTAYPLDRPDRAFAGRRFRVTAQHDRTDLSLCVHEVPAAEGRRATAHAAA